ncbi:MULTISPECIES: EAL domain-containing protein [unclassified Azospirillum]|uniref:GGDEF/EAL domain-containing response regulator n=1 Tax=unclassified Azospirillum TaxID=2630922 RepID=UPI000B765433|nr:MULTISPECIES: EAL domain-containing protein [unclassified Azospirillum]SNS98774.1 response regulator receiver modulated diguanylate cyclase/phosphodiesterase [Azospirillum sp. RU38E]SNT15081.1 response regulator receiver modulated diguanylate cyclase/phosphodiesterase [Azospirillum sp. RU37A]
MEEDLLVFAAEPDAAQPAPALCPWLILIVDDDPSVHSVTKLALRDLVHAGRRPLFLSAYSAVEARQILAAYSDIALVLLDVVMESEDAGLDLARAIREELGNQYVRIILRTGQPGQAPEREVVARYDINDYRAKDELTAARLWTSVLTALRAYQQIRALEANRAGLAHILDATARLFEQRDVNRFAAGVVDSLLALAGPGAGALLARVEMVEGEPVGEPRLLAGRLAGGGPQARPLLPAGPLSHTVPPDICQQIVQALAQPTGVQGAGWLAIHTAASPSVAVIIHLSGLIPDHGPDQRVMALFARTIAIGLDNALLVEQLSRDRTHDRATGLLNRTGLVAALGVRLGLLGEDGAGSCAVALIDLRRFRDFNQELGVAWGDQLLSITARRVVQAAGPAAACARTAGDQFAIMLPGGPDLEMARAQVRAILAAVSEPVTLAGREVHPLATPGLAWCNLPGRHAEEMLARAEESLHASKRAFGRLQEVLVGDDSDQNRLGLTMELNAALKQNQFELYYQPIVDAVTRKVVAFEALVRWKHPARGIMVPASFIPAAEETGLIVPIGTWAMREAATRIAEWTRASGRPIWVSVNISAAQLSEPGFLDHVKRVVAESGVDPTLLKLEVTESTIIGDPAHAAEILSGLRDLGIRLCMDDFGTGYSNLSYLQTLPFDFLKVDRAFVSSMIDRFESRTILRTMLALAQQLSLEVVAEGVETLEQADELERLGCGFLQGFLYGKPMPAELAGAMLGVPSGPLG